MDPTPAAPSDTSSLEEGQLALLSAPLWTVTAQGERNPISTLLHPEHHERTRAPNSGARHCRARGSPRRRSPTAARPRQPSAALHSRSANELTNVSQVLITSSMPQPEPRSPCPHLSLARAHAAGAAQPLPARKAGAQPGAARPESSPTLSDREQLLASAARQRAQGMTLPRCSVTGLALPRLARGGTAAQMCERRYSRRAEVPGGGRPRQGSSCCCGGSRGCVAGDRLQPARVRRRAVPAAAHGAGGFVFLISLSPRSCWVLPSFCLPGTRAWARWDS